MQSLTKILITGGLGFIGSNFVRSILSSDVNYTVVNLDCVSYGANPNNLADISQSDRYHFVKGDTADAKVTESIVNEAELVVHFAAETHVDRSIIDPQPFIRSNVIGTFTLLEAARKGEIGKFVHVSTDEVYGPAPGNVRFTEQAPCIPSSPYAASKAASDMLVQAYHKTYGLPTIIARCTNNLGPFQHPEKFIPKSIIRALMGEVIPLYGTGAQIRDWIYVLDFCRAIRLMMEKGENGSIYNVSAANEMPNVEIASMILRKLGKPKELIRFVEDRPGHDFRYSLDSSRIRKELGWAPSHSFRDSLSATVDWYAKNECWWKPLISERVLSASPWKES